MVISIDLNRTPHQIRWILSLGGGGGGGGVDILTTPVFGRPLFSPYIIILSENLGR